MSKREQKIRPDGIHTNLDGVGVHHRVFLPSSWDGTKVEALVMVDGPADTVHVDFAAAPGNLHMGFLLAPNCATQLRELARMFVAAADVLDEVRT